jgi:hypothetical protein
MDPLRHTRLSPVRLPAEAAETADYRGFRIVRRFLDESAGPRLVDLSHLGKWDLQSGGIQEMEVAGVKVPDKPGQSQIGNGLLVNRLNATQVSIWDLEATGLDLSAQPAATDVSDGICLLALLGSEVFAVMERVSALDLGMRGRAVPYVLQGPVLNIPTQVAVLHDSGQRVVLLGFSRGYGQTMAETLLDRGSRLGLRPGGFMQFEQLMQRLSLA